MDNTTQFQEIVSHLSDLITVITTEGVITFENDALLPLLGYTQEEIIGKNALTYVHPLDLPSVMGLLAEGLKNPGKGYIAQLRFKHKNGSWITLEISAVYLPHVPSINGVLVVSRDVSASARIDNLTRTLEKAVDTAGEIIFVTDPKGIFTYVNPQFTAVYGYTSEEVCGKVTPRILKSGTQSKEASEQFWKELLNKEIVQREIVNKHKSGELLTIEGSSSVIVDDSGVIIGFLSIQRDISNRKKLEQDLRTYQLAVEHATNHIVITDPDGKILYANSGVEKITGFTREEVIGQTPRLWGKQMDKDFYNTFWQMIKTERKPFVGELRNKRKNGELYWAIASVSPIIEKDTLIGFVGVEEDITERKHSEEMQRQKTEELERANGLMVGRELKMIELKKQIEELQKRLAAKES